MYSQSFLELILNVGQCILSFVKSRSNVVKRVDHKNRYLLVAIFSSLGFRTVRL